MQGKGAKKSLKNVTDRDVRKYTIEAREALNPNYFVLAKMKAEDPEENRIKAKIIECRLKKGIDPNSYDRTKDSYEYYLHFCSLDRRMDRWIPSEWILQTTDYIESDVKKKKELGAGGHEEEDEEHEGMNHDERVAHEEATKLKTIFKVKFGKYYAETWYYSPYPDEFHDVDCFYYCEFCLSFYLKETELNRHIERCTLNHPP